MSPTPMPWFAHGPGSLIVCLIQSAVGFLGSGFAYTNLLSLSLKMNSDLPSPSMSFSSMNSHDILSVTVYVSQRRDSPLGFT